MLKNKQQPKTITLMNKILRLLFVVFSGLVCYCAYADDKTDVLTWESLGLDGASNSYTDFSGKTISSHAVYAGNASSGQGKYLQLRSKNNAGIVSTNSGGKLKSVKVEYNSETTGDRTFDIYGSNTPYEGPADLYGSKKGEKLGSIALGAEEITLNVEGSYKYVGLRSNNGAMYVDKITVVWEDEGGEVKTATKVELSDGYVTRFTPGKDGDETPLPTATVMSNGAALEGATATWTMKMGDNWIMGEEEPSIGNGKIYIPNHSSGDLILTASYAGDDTYEASNKSYTLKVYKGHMNIGSILEDFPTIGGDSWKAKEEEWNKGVLISLWQVDAQSQTEFTPKETLVTYANGSHTYIKDEAGSLLLYGSGLGYKKGDKISGDLGEGKIGAIYGTLKAYNGLLELVVSKDDVEFVTKSSDNAVEPKTITLAELSQNYMNEYVKIENAEFVEAKSKNLTFKVGEETLAVYAQWSNVDVTTLEAGAVYTLEGMGCVYYKDGNLTNQIYLTGFTGVRPPSTVELSEGYLTRFTTGKDGDETPLPTATVKANDAVIEGATVTWTLKMGDNWVMGEEEPSIGNGKVYIPSHSHGDLILTAKYAGNSTYEASSKSYTLKVYKGYMNIQDVLEQFPEVGGDTWAGKETDWNKGYQASFWEVDAKSETEFAPKEALVTYVNGSYTYIQDDAGALLLYGSGLGFKKGDIITCDLGEDKGYGGIYGTLKTYNGLLELAVSKADVEFAVKSKDNAVEPKTITVDELNQSNLSQFLKIDKAVFVGADKENQKKLTFMVDKKEFLVFNQWNVNVAGLKEGTEYALEGMGSIEYKDGVLSNRLNLTSFAESVNAPRIKSFKLTINHDGEVFTESFPASEWQNIVIEGQTSYLNIKKIEVEVGIPMKYVGFIGTLYNAEDGWQHDDTAWYTVNLEKKNDGLWTLEPEGGIDLTPPEADGAAASKPLTYEFFIYAEDENGTPMHYNNDGKNYKVTFTPADDPNAIGNVKADSSKSATYNLSGQPVTRTYRGVVIQNARKVLR